MVEALIRNLLCLGVLLTSLAHPPAARAHRLDEYLQATIVAIEPESGAYFLGEDEIEATDKARAAGYEGPFYFLRVGSRYTHRLMTPR